MVSPSSDELDFTSIALLPYFTFFSKQNCSIYVLMPNSVKISYSQALKF